MIHVEYMRYIQTQMVINDYILYAIYMGYGMLFVYNTGLMQDQAMTLPPPCLNIAFHFHSFDLNSTYPQKLANFVALLGECRAFGWIIDTSTHDTN